MKLVQKMMLAVLGLLVVSSVLVGIFVAVAFRDLRTETYRWFDTGARNIAVAIGNQTRESVAYFDYQTIEDNLRKRLADDKNLTYASVVFGAGPGDRREVGNEKTGPFRPYVFEVRDSTKMIVLVTIHYSTAGVEGKLRALTSRLVLGLLLTLFVLLLLLYGLILRLVIRPLGQIVRYAEITASGDLTVSVSIASKDEFGTLALTLNRMTGNLRALYQKIAATFGDLEVAARDIADVSHRVNAGSVGQTDAVLTVSSSIDEMNASVKSVVQSVENLFALAGESSSSMLEMAASVDQVAGNAEGLSTAVEQTSSSISQMFVSIRTVAEHVGRLAELVTSTSSAIAEIEAVVREVERNAGEGRDITREVARTMSEDGLVSLRRTAERMHAIRGSVRQAASVIHSLENSAHEIGSIVGVINEVNDQTNLLALNAAILAAQAGDHGRGFAVVAEEIRELSARTASSTKEIAKLIASVQKESTNAVAAMEDGTQQVEEGVRIVAELSETIQRAAENSEKASASSRGIALSTTEQYKGIRQITISSQTVNEMAQKIARSTREQSQGGDQIVKASEELRDLAFQVKKAMVEQAKGIRLTSQASEESARLSQQVLDATRAEARGIDLVAKTAGSIQEISNSNAAIVESLDRMVGTLTAQAALVKRELARFIIQ